ncbi:MAG: hypothetical protein U0736_01285 [Gemmataceae bacterium]
MYRLDLADPRVALPVAVSDRGGHGRANPPTWRAWQRAGSPSSRFDRPVPGSVAVRRSDGRLTVTDAKKADDAAFYALPADHKDAPAATAPALRGPRRRRHGALPWRSPLAGSRSAACGGRRGGRPA